MVKIITDYTGENSRLIKIHANQEFKPVDKYGYDKSAIAQVGPRLLKLYETLIVLDGIEKVSFHDRYTMYVSIGVAFERNDIVEALKPALAEFFGDVVLPYDAPK